MADFTTAAGQNVYDIALQIYGSIEEIGKVLQHVESLIDEIEPNSVLPLEDAVENNVNQFFARRKDVATRTLNNETVILSPGGEAVLDTEGNELEFI